MPKIHSDSSDWESWQHTDFSGGEAVWCSNTGNKLAKRIATFFSATHTYTKYTAIRLWIFHIVVSLIHHKPWWYCRSISRLNVRMSGPGEINVDPVETLHKGQEDGIPYTAQEISTDGEKIAPKRWDEMRWDEITLVWWCWSLKRTQTDTFW